MRPHDLTDEHGEVAWLLELLVPPAWHADAACREHPELSWFPDKSRAAAAAAKLVCQGCLVAEECRTWSLEQGSTLDGIWGGLTKQDRARLRREQRAA